MAIITPDAVRRTYDVIVVGSGAGGGQTAYTLALEGIKVLMLESGAYYDPASAPMFQTPHQAPLRGAATPDKQMGFYDATVDGGWTIPGEPYTNASSDVQGQFRWWRARMLGGRTNHWGAWTLRNGPYDFKPRTRDGLGFDWPISYEDIAPYYDKVEMLLGVCGARNGLENVPDSPPGCLLPPPKGRVSDLLVQQRARGLGIPFIPVHRAVLTQRLDSKHLPAKLHPGNPFAQKIVRAAMESRAACFWATQCERGCSIRAKYQSTTVHLPPAEASGNLDIVCRAMVREVNLDAKGNASGVTFVDKMTGKDQIVRGRVVVLAAGAFESVRILLNSRSERYPNGLANSSGRVGKYLMDTVVSGLTGQVPLLENLPPHNEDGAGGTHFYAPWWLYPDQLAGKLDFARGYHIDFGGGRRMPNTELATDLAWASEGSYGRKFKEAARRYYGSFVGLTGWGEMIPNDQCFCEIDSSVRDRFGIPVLRFHWRWSEQELRMAVHMQKTFGQIITAMGGRVQGSVETNGNKAINKGGEGLHEVGGAIMGEDPRTSVTNQWSQTHDVHNLFITDGAPFASNSDKNPTLTIMALAWRAADRIAADLKRGLL